MSAVPKTLEWIGGTDGFLRLLDQTRLPGQVAFRDCRMVEEVWEAIKSLRVRGAPAIGVAAAYGVVIGAKDGNAAQAAHHLRTSRPTAVNLFWALDRMRRVIDSRPKDLPSALLREAVQIDGEDQLMCQRIGRNGASLVPDGGGVLTHCNAGSLATAGAGTALAVLYEAHFQRKRFRVFADETRPLLQGARLTAWELREAGLDVTVLCDNMAGSLMQSGAVQMCIVGADRIAANGDTANKIGTYGVALLAHAHGIPFYVAAPSSTFDLACPSGQQIPIEQRDPREVTHGFGSATAPDGVHVYNPAFDVTPARLIAGIVTEFGVIRPVNEDAIRQTLSTRSSQN
jgi:methylthioribose-1-phosphate isomerase